VSEVAHAPSRAWQWLGLKLVDTGDGTATVEMLATEDMANHSGFVHGGMISTLADSAMGRSLRTLKPGVARAMSFDLKLSFINAAKIGESLRATGHVIRAGRRTAVAECRVEGQGGRLVATASATFAITRETE
jgi:acyl-CoA thioesterase